MKAARAAILVSLLLLGKGWSEDVPSKEVVVPEDPSPFSDGFELGLYGAGAMPGSGEDAVMGGGVSLAYYFTPQIGIDTSYAVFAFEDEVHTVSADLVLRYPVSQAVVAPYLMIGGGFQTNGESDGLYRLGGGLDVRFQDNFGIFADGVYNWVVGQDNFTIARLGVRIPF